MTDELRKNALCGDDMDRLANAAQDNPLALARLAQVAWLNRMTLRASTYAEKACALAPDDAEIRSITGMIFADIIPKWHFKIIKDKARNAAFEDALLRAIKPDLRVLDIGAGTGLLSMIAAKAGAKQIISCEANPAIAQTAAKIVQQNGYADQVKIIAKHSTAINPDTDMGGQADIIVSEIVANDFVTEGVLPALRDAAQRLLAPGGKMIPQGGSIQIALAYWSQYDDFCAAKENDFDLSGFNALLPHRHSLKVHDPDLTMCSESYALYDFDFYTTQSPMITTDMELVAAGGRVNGIVQWIKLQMDAKDIYENKPGKNAQSTWACQFYPFAVTQDMIAGEKRRIFASLAHNKLRIWG